MGIQSRIGNSAPPAKGRRAATAAMLLAVAADDRAAQTVQVSKDLLKTTAAADREDAAEPAASTDTGD